MGLSLLRADSIQASFAIRASSRACLVVFIRRQRIASYYFHPENNVNKTYPKYPVNPFKLLWFKTESILIAYNYK